ncbi:hypothetical protein HNY73_021995 [Argiope bruennichi]|uniref:Uncharacterized protein n=1 Tax=Argiope bruennichi TaxID=94029 RepID=A0A8T0E342_ARGBR|nr:hypothetical protein HNY73_021995 [Argiope bruennichi]
MKCSSMSETGKYCMKLMYNHKVQSRSFSKKYPKSPHRHIKHLHKSPPTCDMPVNAADHPWRIRNWSTPTKSAITRRYRIITQRPSFSSTILTFNSFFREY